MLKRSVRLSATIAFMMLLCPIIVWSQEKQVMNEPRTLAESAAREQFIIESGGSDLGNYTVRITELADAFEVVFVPNQPPMIKDRSGEVVVILGGQTIYGKEVHYLIEKNTYHVARRTFGR